MKRFAYLPITLSLLCAAQIFAREIRGVGHIQHLAAICAQPDEVENRLRGEAIGELEREPIRFRKVTVGNRYIYTDSAGYRQEIELMERGGRIQQLFLREHTPQGKPRLMIAMNARCQVTGARRVDYDLAGQPEQITELDAQLQPNGKIYALNPPLEFTQQPGPLAVEGMRVALVDSGVNYQLPEIRGRLARRPDGSLVGYDFWDLDTRPFDAFISRGFFVQRHGTRTASLLLREAPEIALVPYRVPRPDLARMADLVQHAHRNGVRIVGISLGSPHADQWQAFAEAIRQHPEILFIASAGNDGQDIDSQPVYPAAFKLENLLVVTSADDFLRPAERVNWGKTSVDYLIPAEQLDAIDFGGEVVKVSGSSYAVPRLVALAARLLAREPDLTLAQLLEQMDKDYTLEDFGVKRWVKRGYIPDPQTNELPNWRPVDSWVRMPSHSGIEWLMNSRILVLDRRWNLEKIRTAWQQAWGILAQCGIGAGEFDIQRFDGPDYLRDLSTGHAFTLLKDTPSLPVKIVLSRDTRMQAQFTGEAFGEGNTLRRPWLRNSVWLVSDIKDPGIALAHELFHVLANDGTHINDKQNLMQPDTHPDATTLLAGQCELARARGLASGVLRRAR